MKLTIYVPEEALPLLRQMNEIEGDSGALATRKYIELREKAAGYIIPAVRNAMEDSQ